jgi:hypothetical protein
MLQIRENLFWGLVSGVHLVGEVRSEPRRVAAYHRRTQIETVISMIKRRQGAHARCRTYHSQCHDLRLMV